MSAGGPQVLRATAVAINGRGLLIQGAPGAGKSSLALSLMALGAELVADDGVTATVRDGALHLTAPEATAGLIEARHFGLIRTQHVAATAAAVVDLAQTETERLPSPHEIVIQGIRLPLFRRVEAPHFPAILAAYLKGESLQR